MGAYTHYDAGHAPKVASRCGEFRRVASGGCL